MIRTEQGYAQIFKIYGKSETEVKEKLQDLLKCGGAVVIYTRRRRKRCPCSRGDTGGG